MLQDFGRGVRGPRGFCGIEIDMSMLLQSLHCDIIARLVGQAAELTWMSSAWSNGFLDTSGAQNMTG